MKEIPLRNGGVATVDDEDYEALSRHNWRWLKTGNRVYVARYGLNEQKSSRIFYMHREIMRPAKGQCVDHVNGDSFDNRRANLRFATYAENARNCKVYKNNTTGYKGVQRRGRGFSVEIQYNRKRLTAPGFDTAEEAAAFYNDVTGKLFGDYARPNLLSPETESDWLF